MECFRDDNCFSLRGNLSYSAEPQYELLVWLFFHIQTNNIFFEKPAALNKKSSAHGLQYVAPVTKVESDLDCNQDRACWKQHKPCTHNPCTFSDSTVVSGITIGWLLQGIKKEKVRHTYKLASWNRSWHSKAATFRALGMAGIESTPSESGCG